jgi:hypothetical protein
VSGVVERVLDLGAREPTPGLGHPQMPGRLVRAARGYAERVHAIPPLRRLLSITLATTDAEGLTPTQRSSLAATSPYPAPRPNPSRQH